MESKKNTNGITTTAQAAVLIETIEPVLTPLDLDRYGTVTTKAEAIKAALAAGKTQAEAEAIADSQFTVQVPDLAMDVDTIIASFVWCYGFVDDPKKGTATDQFWLKCQKHLCDKLRADQKRTPRAGIAMTPEQQMIADKLSRLSPERRAEFISLLNAI